MKACLEGSSDMMLACDRKQKPWSHPRDDFHLEYRVYFISGLQWIISEGKITLCRVVYCGLCHCTCLQGETLSSAGRSCGKRQAGVCRNAMGWVWFVKPNSMNELVPVPQRLQHISVDLVSLCYRIEIFRIYNTQYSFYRTIQVIQSILNNADSVSSVLCLINSIVNTITDISIEIVKIYHRKKVLRLCIAKMLWKLLYTVTV